MAHLVRLITGDKRSPSRSLTIASSSSTANIHLRTNGFSPGPGKQKIVWSGESVRFDGEQRVDSSRGNAKFDLTYDLNGTSAARIRQLQDEIKRFFQDAGLYEERRGGEPVWLEYRWQDNLDSLPAPTLGQLSHFIRILNGDFPQWPRDLHSGALVAGNVEGVVVTLICGPFWEGLEQKLFNGLGQLEIMPNGLLIPRSTTNQITNPSFGNATWNGNWTASNANLKAIQETRLGLTRSLPSAAHLYNQSGSTAYTYTITVTLSANTFFIYCYARRPDGAAVTVADLAMWGQGASRTTTYLSVGDGWYLCSASYTAAAASSTHGVEVKAKADIIIDDVMCHQADSNFDNFLPFLAGHLVGCTWSGTAHSSTSTRTQPLFRYPTLDYELCGHFTYGGWLTTLWSDTDPNMVLCVWDYFIDTSNFIRLQYDGPNRRFVLTKTIGGSASTGNGSTQTFSYGANLHLVTVQDGTTLKLYLNGAVDISITVGPGIAGGGVLSLGVNVESSTAPINGIIDGWRGFDRALTATEADTLYDNELPIKAAGGSVGLPTAFWTKDGDAILDAVDDTNRDNYGVVVGVNGNVPAITEWRIQPPTSTPPRVYWLARKATTKAFEAGLLFLDFQGAADATSAGGEYNTATSASEMTPVENISSIDHNNLRGRYKYLARIYVATASVSVKPAYHWNATSQTSATLGDAVTVGADATFLLKDFGELLIWYKDSRIKPLTIMVYLQITPSGSATVRLDFVQLLPYPNVRIGATDASIAISTGDLIIYNSENGDAYIHRTSDAGYKYDCEVRGEAVDLEPHKYNTIFFLAGEEGTGYDITDTGTFTIYVTPRWTLPGGAIA